MSSRTMISTGAGIGASGAVVEAVTGDWRLRKRGRQMGQLLATWPTTAICNLVRTSHLQHPMCAHATCGDGLLSTEIRLRILSAPVVIPPPLFRTKDLILFPGALLFCSLSLCLMNGKKMTRPQLLCFRRSLLTRPVPLRRKQIALRQSLPKLCPPVPNLQRNMASRLPTRVPGILPRLNAKEKKSAAIEVPLSRALQKSVQYVQQNRKSTIPIRVDGHCSWIRIAAPRLYVSTAVFRGGGRGGRGGCHILTEIRRNWGSEKFICRGDGGGGRGIPS